MKILRIGLVWGGFLSLVFSLSAQTFTTLDSFGGLDAFPVAPLVQATDGNLYGTTSGVDWGGTVFRITTSGTLTTLHSFSFDLGAGWTPMVGLVQATNGKLYGTTSGVTPSGPTNCNFMPCPEDSTIFQITTAGTLETIYNYNASAGPQGLVQASNGDLYGTDTAVAGSVFRITTTGALTTLYSFCSQTNCTDGSDPQAGLVQGTDGNFYGTTYSGGAYGLGTVFKITPSGKLTTLHSFDNTDGAGPAAGLIQASDGNFYGTTYSGGVYGLGTVFEITGTTYSGEAYGLGAVFEITRGGILTTLHSFANTDGANPLAALIQATDGNFYGTTFSGGTNNEGTVFNMTPTGKLTTLYNFCSVIEDDVCRDGNNPAAGLVQATNGIFYGTTKEGGAEDHCTAQHVPNSCGTLFSLSLGLGPFVETQATSGKVGAAVTILGTDLTGASGVTFNGTAAVFQVVSASEITTTVPSGATTGKVKVVTPGSTLTSNVKFRVTR